MTLAEWIQKYAKNPLLRVVSLALGIQVLYFCFLGYNRYTEQLEKIELLRESISIGVQQSNRPLIESAMMSSLSNPYISAVLLCSNNESQMVYPPDSRDYCGKISAQRKIWAIRRSIIGVQDIDLIVILSPFVALNPIAFSIFASIVMAGVIFWLLTRVRKRFELEVLNPISEGLSADIPLGVKELEELRSKNMERTRLEREKAHMEVLLNLSAQVAHDIRSPLVALDSVFNKTDHLPEKQRLMVRHAVNRIRDIANNLLEKNRQQFKVVPGAGATTVTGEPSDAHLLSSLIDPVITEKRLQFESKPGINIYFELTQVSYGLFGKVQPVEFGRVVSNLVNNAVEAFGDEGAVKVGLAQDEASVVLTITDNGIGIPLEILTKLGQRGETHGKAGGSGLGLFHARTTVESWGGSLILTSELGKGTTVVIKLPRAAAPPEFVPELRLIPGRPVVVLDDDVSVHQVWQGRFGSACAKEHEIEAVYFSVPDKLREWVKNDPAKADAALYLFDYELLDPKETGLSLAEELGICERTILVTGRYEERRIIEECRRLKVRMIPKGLSGFVPIVIGSPVKSAQAVLIDDDALVHMNWEDAAASAGVELKAFKDPAGFMSNLAAFPKNTSVYIDSELGNGVKGENIAAELREKGFTDITLETGHAPERFAHLPWLKVQDKESPWK